LRNCEARLPNLRELGRYELVVLLLGRAGRKSVSCDCLWCALRLLSCDKLRQVSLGICKRAFASCPGQHGINSTRCQEKSLVVTIGASCLNLEVWWACRDKACTPLLAVLARRIIVFCENNDKSWPLQRLLGGKMINGVICELRAP